METTTERRQHERYGVNQKVYTCCRLHSPKVAEVLDISNTGLAFTYVGRAGPSDESLELDIVFPDGTDYISKVPCTTVSDLALQADMRRCSVQFGKLSRDQKTKLDFFIRNYCSSISKPSQSLQDD